MARLNITRALATLLTRYLTSPSPDYQPVTTNAPHVLRQLLLPGDVVLVEGNLRISAAIKYLTQSTWSHACLYIGDALGDAGDSPRALVEADLANGVIAVPLAKYEHFHTRICRPVNLTPEDRQTLVEFVVARIGLQYDLKNVIDLMRYLLPTPPVPVRWRRRLLALGSGDPTRAICSTLIAQAFQAIGYPILPTIEKLPTRAGDPSYQQRREILHIRHHSLFAPRDFDISPYFQIVKPTLEQGFDYRELVWAHRVETTDTA